jgi:paired amphipathic helix protein Sin3a
LQQIAYRSSAEATLANDENLYRIEWTPVSSHSTSDPLLLGTLRFQLMGRDAASPEDLPAAERLWAKYVEGYVKLERTPDLVIDPKIPYLPRNLRQLGIPPPPPSHAADVRPTLPKGLTVVSALQSRICLRSYKMFFCADTEDVLFRRVRDADWPSKEFKTKKVKRVVQWLGKRTKEVEASKVASADAPEAKADETKEADAETAAAPIAAATETKAAAPAEEKMDVEAEPAAKKEEAGDEEKKADVEMKA